MLNLNREVSVIGVGMTHFGAFPESGFMELGEEALWNAIKDARIDPQKIEAVYCGYATDIITETVALVPHAALKTVGITGIPIIRIEAGCASASASFREALIAIGSGVYDVAIAMGIERMSGGSKARRRDALSGGFDEEKGLTMAGMFAMVARVHMEKYGTTLEQLAKVSVKNRRNAARNPLAHFQKEVTIEEVLNSPMVADPLRLLNCCPPSDGCAVAILAASKIAHRFTDSNCCFFVEIRNPCR